MLLADLVTLSWVGMWRGLCAKDANRAILGTALQVLALPWLALAWTLYGLYQVMIVITGRARVTTRNLPAAAVGVAGLAPHESSSARPAADRPSPPTTFKNWRRLSALPIGVTRVM